jgi:molybdopterin biosynthesis enzyme
LDTTLTIVAVIHAGEEPAVRRINAGVCAKIMTGAMVPAGADCVVKREYALETGTTVCFSIRAAYPNICRAGEDLCRGGAALRRGKTERREALPVWLAAPGIVMPVAFHGSAHINAMCAAAGLVFLDVGVTAFEEGDTVTVRSLRD